MISPLLVLVIIYLFHHLHGVNCLFSCSNVTDGLECSTTDLQYIGTCPSVLNNSVDISCCLRQNLNSSQICINFIDFSCSESYQCINGRFYIGIFENTTNTLMKGKRCLDLLDTISDSNSSSSLNNGTQYDNCWDSSNGGPFTTTLGGGSIPEIPLSIDISCVDQTTLITNACQCYSCKIRQFLYPRGIDGPFKPSFSIHGNRWIANDTTTYDCSCIIMPSYFMGSYQFLSNMPVTNYFNPIDFSIDPNNVWVW